MLEFFTIAYYVNKMNCNGKKECKKMNEMFKDKKLIMSIKKDPINMDALNLVAGIITLIISLFAARLAYQCNYKLKQGSQIIAILFAFLFSGFYLLYYFIWRIILGNKC